MKKVLEEKLGRRLSTRELAEYLGVDIDHLRRNYEAFGGIRPVSGGRILFFEQNVVDALRGNHGIENQKKRPYSLGRTSPKARCDTPEVVGQQNGSFGLGSGTTKSRLEQDRHRLLAD